MSGAGWRVSMNTVFSGGLVTVIRRNALVKLAGYRGLIFRSQWI